MAAKGSLDEPVVMEGNWTDAERQVNSHQEVYTLATPGMEERSPKIPGGLNTVETMTSCTSVTWQRAKQRGKHCPGCLKPLNP